MINQRHTNIQIYSVDFYTLNIKTYHSSAVIFFKKSNNKKAASSCEAQQRHSPQSSRLLFSPNVVKVHTLSVSQLQHDSKIATIWTTSYNKTADARYHSISVS